MQNNDNDYIVCQWKVRCLKVINNATEQGVTLIHEFYSKNYNLKGTETVPVASDKETLP